MPLGLIQADCFENSVREAELGEGPGGPSVALLVEQWNAGSLAWLPLRLVWALSSLTGPNGPEHPHVGHSTSRMGSRSSISFQLWAFTLFSSNAVGVLVTS